MAILAFWREILIALLLAYGLWQRGERIDAEGNLDVQIAQVQVLGDKVAQCNAATKSMEDAGKAAIAAGRAAKVKAEQKAAAAAGEIDALKKQLAAPTPAGATCADALGLVRQGLAPR